MGSPFIGEDGYGENPAGGSKGLPEGSEAPIQEVEEIPDLALRGRGALAQRRRGEGIYPATPTDTLDVLTPLPTGVEHAGKGVAADPLRINNQSLV